jgi:hypothetical protein
MNATQGAACQATALDLKDVYGALGYPWAVRGSELFQKI